MYQRPVLLNFTKHSMGISSPWQTLEENFSSVGGNTGNMAFLHAILLTVKGILPLTERPIAEADIKIWGCSNFIAPNRDMKVNNSPIYLDGKPMVAIGLGAQGLLSGEPFSIPENTIEWVKTLRALAPNRHCNISVRGKYTYDLLKLNNLHDGAVVLGCPSLFIAPHKHLGEKIKRKLNNSNLRFIGIAPGNPLTLSKQCIEIESWLVELLNRHGGTMLVQHPLELWQLSVGHSAELSISVLNDIRLKIAPHLNNEEFLIWYKTRARSFHDVTSWLYYLRGLDLVVSMRIHGAQLALQSGTPALCIAIDSRQVELCEVMKVPYLPMSEFTPSMTQADVLDRLRKHDWDLFDENRRQLASSYLDFLRNVGLSPSEHMMSLS